MKGWLSHPLARSRVVEPPPQGPSGWFDHPQMSKEPPLFSLSVGSATLNRRSEVAEQPPCPMGVVQQLLRPNKMTEPLTRLLRVVLGTPKALNIGFDHPILLFDGGFTTPKPAM
jgi:hypothetical protein